jgi:CRP-like cAMP-binding protein
MKADKSFGKTTNWLLRGLGFNERQLVWPLLSRRPLAIRTYLERTGVWPSAICFIESGVVSSLETGDLREPIEVGVVGREGMIGLSVIANLIPQRDSLVQVGGEGLFADVGAFQECVRSSISLRAYLFRYIQAQTVQISLAASAAARATIQQRLARKLLMYHDRTGIDTLPLTHETISLMLGVRRASVTHAIHNLEATGHIHAQRGLITIRDRQGLEEYCGRFYGVAETRYAVIMGDPPRAASLHSV